MLLSSLVSKEFPNVLLRGVVDVALLDLAVGVGKMGNALSWGRGMASGEGVDFSKGAVATRSIFLNGDFLPLSDDAGDVRPELLGLALDVKGGLGGGCISSTGTTFFKLLPVVDFSNSLAIPAVVGTAGALPDRSDEGACPIGTRAERTKGPSSVRGPESGARRAAEGEPVSTALEADLEIESAEHACSPIWEMGISTAHSEHVMVGRKLEALIVVAMLFSLFHCLSTTIRPGPRNVNSGMRPAVPLIALSFGKNEGQRQTRPCCRSSVM